MRFLFSRKRRQAELNEEIQGHLEMAVRDRMERGEDAAQARAAAKREFGNVALVREVRQDQWGWTWLENLFQDLHFGARMLRKFPGLSIVAVLTLALGIGANAGVFSVVNTLLLRSLPFREPDRLTLLQNFVPPHDTAAQFHDWQRQRQYFADAAVFEDIDADLRAGRGVIRAHCAATSWNFFSVLGTQPILGDGFTQGDDGHAHGQGMSGSNGLAVIGYGLWQELFGGSPKALGATIRVEATRLPSLVWRRRGLIIPIKRWFGQRELSTPAMTPG